MGRRPLYIKNKNSSLFVIVLMLVLLFLVYGYNQSFDLNSLVENSMFNDRKFQGKVEEIISDNSNIKFYFMQQNEVPIVAVSFVFENTGSAYDSVGKKGIASLVTATIKDGTFNKSVEEIRDEIGIKGISISFDNSKDNISGKLVAPKEYFKDAAILLRDILTRPRFEKKYLEITKLQMIKSLEVEKEKPAKELSLANNKLVFGDHEYSQNPLGNKDDLIDITQDDLKKFVRDRLAKDNLYVGVAGDLTKNEAVEFVNDIFGGLNEKNLSKKIENVVLDFNKPEVKIDRNDGQNIVVFTTNGTCRKCDDFYPLYVANYIFGGAGLNSRLNQKIREKEGLTYGANSSMILDDKANLLTVSFSTTKDNFAKAVLMFRSEWENVSQNGFSNEEVEFAKNYLIASYNLRFASISGIADILVMQQKYDLGLDFLNKRNSYVKNVNVEDVNNVVKKYFTSNLLQAQIGTFN